MKSPPSVLNRFSGDTRLCVLVGAVLGILGTAAISTTRTIDTTPVVIGAAVAGFLYDRGINGGHRIGTWAGLLGTLTAAPLVPLVLGYSWPFALSAALLGVVWVVFGVVFGMVGGAVGGVARSKLGRAWRGSTSV